MEIETRGALKAAVEKDNGFIDREDGLIGWDTGP